MNKIQEAYKDIHASEELKSHTLSAVRQAQTKKKLFHIPKYAYALCACLLCLLIGSSSYTYLQKPVSYVSIDINPSIELSLNRMDRVVTATAYNDDGSNVLAKLNLKNCTYEDAFTQIENICHELGYIKENSLLQVTVISDSEDRLIEKTNTLCSKSDCIYICENSNSDLAEEAHSHGMSFGKYKAYLELKDVDPNCDLEDIRNLTMREIHDMLSESGCNSDSDNGNNNGHNSDSGNDNNNGHHSESGNGKRKHNGQH